MKVEEIKELVERKPFRPLAVRRSNGVRYVLNEPRDVRAPRDFRLIMHLGESQAVRVDPDSIVEVLEG